MRNFDIIRGIIINLPPVGFYTRPDSVEVPAVWYGAEPPTTYKVKGIEILVDETDFSYSIPVGSPTSRLKTSSVEVTMVQHDRGSTHNTTFKNIQQILVDEMIKKYSQLEIESTPGTNNLLEQFIVRGRAIVQTQQ